MNEIEEVSMITTNESKQLNMMMTKMPSINRNVLQSTCSIQSDANLQLDEAQMTSLTNETESRLINFDKLKIGANYLDQTIDEISVKELDRKLILGENIYLIDARDMQAFRNGHIISAQIFNCTTRLMTMKSKKDWDRLKLQLKLPLDEIVLYNKKGDKTAVVMNFMNYLKNDCRKIFFLTGGYEEYVNLFSFAFIESSSIPEGKNDSSTNQLKLSQHVFDARMTEILPFLFLGNELDSMDAQVLQERKITHILNVTINVPFHHKNLFICKRLSAVDSNKQDMRAYFDEAIEFIDDAQ